MWNALRIPSFASLVLGSFASIVNMTARTVWLVGAVTLAVFVIIETSALNETKLTGEDYQGLKTYDVKGKEKKLKLWRFMLISRKDAGDDLETKIKPIFKKYKITRLRVEPFGKEQSIDCHDREHLLITDKDDETHKDKVKRNATALNEFKGAKKSHKKLKLAHTQAGYKNWKNKERSSDSGDDKPVDSTKKISRRYVNYFPNNEDQTGRWKRNAVTKNLKGDKSGYYAQRKAVMDRFHARQREIAEKYANKTSMTSKYMHKYDLEKKNNVSLSLSVKITRNNINKSKHAVNKTNNGLETSTSAPSTISTREQITKTTTTNYPINRSIQTQATENSLEQDVEEDYDEDSDYVEDSNDYQKTNDVKQDDNSSDTLKWGDCTGKLVYQHNIIIRVHQASQTIANITTSVNGQLCVTCIRVVPLNRAKTVSVKLEVNRRQDGSFNNAKLKLNGFQDAQVSFSVRMWAVSKIQNSCSHVS